MFIVNAVEYNNEFISTNTSYNAIFTDHLFQLPSNSGKNLVSIHMTICVINLLKMVHIKHGNSDSVLLFFLKTLDSIFRYSLLIVYMSKRVILKFFNHISNLIVTVESLFRYNPANNNLASIVLIHDSTYKPQRLHDLIIGAHACIELNWKHLSIRSHFWYEISKHLSVILRYIALWQHLMFPLINVTLIYYIPWIHIVPVHTEYVVVLVISKCIFLIQSKKNLMLWYIVS